MAEIIGPGGAVEVIDPDGHILKVNADGSINTSGGGGGTVAVSNMIPAVETGLAKDGTDGTSPPAALGSGTGIRGWLRSIYEKLTGTIAVTGTFYPATQPVSGTVTANLGTIDGAATDASLTTFSAKVPDEEGTWTYKAGVSGTVVVPALGRVIGIAASATGASATVVINGGDAIPITVPTSGVGTVDIAPRANLVAPSIVFTGTTAYLIEIVT